MTVNETHTSLVKSTNRAAWPALNPKIGVIEATLATDLADTANDVITVFSFVDDTIVISAWVEVNTATTGAANISLGKADGADCMAATSVATTGLKFNMTAKIPVLFAAADTLDAHFSADASGGNITVRALCVDAENM